MTVTPLRPPPAPAPTAADLLDELDNLFARFVAFPNEESRWAVVLWVVHAHCIDAFDSTPRLALLSPEKGSGKTRTLEVLGLVVPRPLHAVNISAAALYRVVGDVGTEQEPKERPTLLLDEADTYLGPLAAKQHEDLRGLINAGHRRGAEVYRGEVAGKTVKVIAFPAFSAAALAGIGDLPDTIIDRSIVVTMKRRAQHEEIESFRERKVRPEAEELRESISAWARSHTTALAEAWPELPAGITDRAADVWEPLVAVADAAGGDWPKRAREAAVALNNARQQRDPSLGIQLLTDCRRLYNEKRVERLATETLVEALNALEESPWGDMRGKPLDARGLARRLRKYDVRPGDHRFDSGIRKGYRLEDFHDAWSRYLPAVADVADVAHTRQDRGADGHVAPGSEEVGTDLHNNTQHHAQSLVVGGQQGQHTQQELVDVFDGGPF